MFARTGVALTAVGLLAAGLTAFAAAPAGATVVPSQCGFAGGNGPLYSATCWGAAPTDKWDLALTCQNPAETRTVTYYGGIKEGNGTGYAECALDGWTFYSWTIRNLS